ncbi:MAG: hypothetical protein WC543_05580, partial [Candidatus Omnitrophota bacterium]
VWIVDEAERNIFQRDLGARFAEDAIGPLKGRFAPGKSPADAFKLISKSPKLQGLLKDGKMTRNDYLKVYTELAPELGFEAPAKNPISTIVNDLNGLTTGEYASLTMTKQANGRVYYGYRINNAPEVEDNPMARYPDGLAPWKNMGESDQDPAYTASATLPGIRERHKTEQQVTAQGDKDWETDNPLAKYGNLDFLREPNRGNTQPGKSPKDALKVIALGGLETITIKGYLGTYAELAEGLKFSPLAKNPNSTAENDLNSLLNDGYLEIPNLRFRKANEPYIYKVTAKGSMTILAVLYAELDRLGIQLKNDEWEEGNFDNYADSFKKEYDNSKQKKTRTSLNKVRNLINAAEERLALQFMVTALDLAGQDYLSVDNCASAYAKYKKENQISFNLNFGSILERLNNRKLLKEIISKPWEKTQMDKKKYALTAKGLAGLITNANILIRSANYMDSLANIYTSTDSDPMHYSPENTAMKAKAKETVEWATLRLALEFAATNKYLISKKASFDRGTFFELFKKYAENNGFDSNVTSPLFFMDGLVSNGYLETVNERWERDEDGDREFIVYEYRFNEKGLNAIQEVTNPSTHNNSPTDLGGIDLNIQLMTIQRMGSMSGLTFKLPQLSPEALKQFNIAQEMQQLKNMVKAGIEPSGERLKGLVAACVQKGQLRTEANGLLLCLVDVLKLQEDNASESSTELKEALVIVDSQS